MLRDRTFFLPDARPRVTATVKEIEAQTSAEVVVAVRGVSGAYRDVDYLVGFAISLVALLVLLFHPHPFALAEMPLEVVAAFVLGATFCAKVPPLRRLLAPAKRMDASCLAAARAAFVELGVSRTHGRSGILVFVSLFERRVKVVSDVGLDADVLGPEWTRRLGAIEACIAKRADLERFIDALRALGPVLGAAMPRRADDVNELSDEVAE